MASLYPFQNGIWSSNRDGSIFLYVTKAIWKVLDPGLRTSCSAFLPSG